MTPDAPTTPQRRGRARVLLAGLVVVLLLVCVAGGVLARQAHDERTRAAEEQERYGDVVAAATAEAEAFLNIDHEDPQASIDAVAAGATGDFQEQYTSSTDGFLQVIRQEKSVMTGEVVWAGVVDVDEDSATVIAATTGTVANQQTDGRPVARNFRLRLDLVREDGRWLTNDLQFVG